MLVAQTCRRAYLEQHSSGSASVSASVHQRISAACAWLQWGGPPCAACCRYEPTALDTSRGGPGWQSEARGLGPACCVLCCAVLGKTQGINRAALHCLGELMGELMGEVPWDDCLC